MSRRLNQPDSLLETRGKIIAMKEQGKTKREIANEVGLSAIRRSGRISCGFWGWMCAAGPGEIVPIAGHFTAEQYRDILEDVLLPTARTFFPESSIYLVQDNSPINTGRPVRDWMENNPDIILIPWPAKSPDLNVIEYLWALMTRNWNEEITNNARTVDNLTRNVCNVWERLRARNYCQRLVNSMTDRLRACIDSNGYYTKY
ncbi:transposable element-related [Holotrichia oblita]|uniref:Transposable element-related n=1 Tax=Holotrichia oblita TaxID=644536 RepID=A0ACB9TE58_HOLOL|nr:transposable element-related [Holotrichia oblita]